MSLGGVRDEAEIRGHRRTYVGAMPGRIIQSIKRVGVKNPVIMLDEIDKLGMDFRGDPASALLEVLDPAQNNSFSDHYLDVEFDLSSVFFITTANDIGQIPGPLRDRMEIIEIPSYITDEKIQIGLRYLLPRQVEESGLKPSNLSINEDGMRAIIRGYTREAGVRKLEQRIGAICRKIARTVADGKRKRVTITSKSVGQYLGPAPFAEDGLPEEPQIGVALGLAWTPVGGEILVIESTSMPGTGKLQVTGQLGDVMKESSQIALSFLRAHADRLNIDSDVFTKKDIHLHVPEGAQPKEGPSAGIALTSSLASLLSGKPVRNDLCMTGEITLTGQVLPVGGIREKIVAAVAAKFICIADESKLVHTLGQFPLPVEVIPMARSHVARELVKLGGDPIYREGVVTDNGNVILDIYNFPIPQPLAMEQKINNITGVVTNGLFALRPADVLLLGTASGVRTLTAE